MSYGLQEIRATLWNAQNAEQALHVYQGLLWNLQAENVATLRIEVQYHLAVEGDHRHFLRSLNPTVPREFEPLLKTNGVAYTIGIDEESLTIQVTVVPSVIVPSGLYLSVAYDFLKFGADWLAKIPELTQKYQKFVQLALGLDVKEAL